MSDWWLFEASPLTWAEAIEGGCCPGPQLAKYLHLGSPCGLCFLQHSDWVPRVKFPCRRGRDPMAVCDPALEATDHPFFCGYRLTQIRGRRYKLCPSRGWVSMYIVKRAWCGLGNLVILLEYTTCIFSIKGNNRKRRQKRRKRRKGKRRKRTPGLGKRVEQWAAAAKMRAGDGGRTHRVRWTCGGGRTDRSWWIGRRWHVLGPQP